MLTMPKVTDLELELTTLCNADCPLCYRNYTAFKQHYPKTVIRPLDDIIQQVDTFVDLEWIRLVGTVSEPTLYKPFLQLVEYIKGRGIRIEICTNGDTNNEAWWADLAVRLTADDKVYFTICGSTQELHEKYRGNTKLERILRNARAFRTENRNDYAQCIRFDYNSADLDSSAFQTMVSEFSNIYMTETYLNKPTTNYVKVDRLPGLQPNPAKIQQYIAVNHFAEIKFHSRIKGKAHCMSWENKSQQVDVEGKVYPCYLFLEASGGEPWDGDYDKILNMQYEVCKHCDRAVIELCDAKDLRYII
jgi:sulfatase maturation enzyme AslB (radical SAM superfamily)